MVILQKSKWQTDTQMGTGAKKGQTIPAQTNSQWADEK